MDVKVTYLEMFARPQRIVPPPRDGLAVLHAKRPTIAYYRFLGDGYSYISYSPGSLLCRPTTAHTRGHNCSFQFL